MSRPVIRVALPMALLMAPSALAAHAQQATPAGNASAEGYYSRSGLYIPITPFDRSLNEASAAIGKGDFATAHETIELAAARTNDPWNRLKADRMRWMLAIVSRNPTKEILALEIINQNPMVPESERASNRQRIERLRAGQPQLSIRTPGSVRTAPTDSPADIQ